MIENHPYSERERKNRKIGATVSIGIHAALLILFILIMAWRAPDPPLPEYGIEVNFGLDDQGSGTVNEPFTAEEPTEEPLKSEELPQEEKVESQPEVTPDEEEPIEPIDAESETPVKEVKKEKVEEVKKTEPIKEEKKEEKKEKKEFKPIATYPDASKDKTGGKSDGDDSNKKGDKGNPEGNFDSRNYYGTPGGGGGGDGASLDMSGWVWDSKPNPKDNSNESGRIVFEIKVNSDGEIVGIKPLQSTVSPAVELIYRREVEKLTFSKQNPQSNMPPVSTGKITFIIRSR